MLNNYIKNFLLLTIFIPFSAIAADISQLDQVNIDTAYKLLANKAAVYPPKLQALELLHKEGRLLYTNDETIKTEYDKTKKKLNIFEYKVSVDTKKKVKSDIEKQLTKSKKPAKQSCETAKSLLAKSPGKIDVVYAHYHSYLNKLENWVANPLACAKQKAPKVYKDLEKPELRPFFYSYQYQMISYYLETINLLCREINFLRDLKYHESALAIEINREEQDAIEILEREGLPRILSPEHLAYKNTEIDSLLQPTSLEEKQKIDIKILTDSLTASNNARSYVDGKKSEIADSHIASDASLGLLTKYLQYTSKLTKMICFADSYFEADAKLQQALKELDLRHQRLFYLNYRLKKLSKYVNHAREIAKEIGEDQKQTNIKKTKGITAAKPHSKPRKKRVILMDASNLIEQELNNIATRDKKQKQTGRKSSTPQTAHNKKKSSESLDEILKALNEMMAKDAKQ